MLCLQLIDFQSGGGASSGDASLNIYTQINEPTKKDGIWIKTNNQYNKAIVDNDHVFSQDGVCKIISNSISNIYGIEKMVIYHNELYAFQSDALYKSNNLSAVLNNGESFVWTKLIGFLDKTVGNYQISTNVPSSVVVYDDKICMTYASYRSDASNTFEILITYNGTDFKIYETPINWGANYSYGLFIYNGDLCCVDYNYNLSVPYSYFSKIDISNGAKTQINIFGTNSFLL